MSLARIENEIKRAERAMQNNNSLRSANQLRMWKEAESRLRRLRKRRFVEQQCNSFADQAAGLQWPGGAEDFLRALHVLWWHLQEDVYCNYSMPRDLSLCSRSCKERLQIVCINAQMQLYGCCEHGSLHECSTRYGVDPDSKRVVPLLPRCSCTIETKQADVVCMFSGRVVSRTISNVRSSSRDFQSDCSSVRGQAGYSYVMAMRSRPSENFKNTDAIREDAKRRKEMQTQAEALDAASASTGSKKRKARQRFEPTDYRSRKVRDEVIAERKRKLLEVAEGVAQRILFDGPRRRRINEYNEARLEQKCIKRLNNYHSANSGEHKLPYWIECVAEFWTPLADFRLLPFVELDHHARRRFGKLVTQLWEICHRSPYARSASAKERSPVSKRQTFCTLKQFSMAVLYAQRDGLFINSGAKGNMKLSFYHNRVQFVPYKAHIDVELPHERELCHFSDAADTQIKQYMCAESKVRGVGELLTRAEAASSKRKKRPKQRNRRVEVARDKSVSEASMLPDHWQNVFIGDLGTYAMSDINRGRKFLLECLNSYDIEFLHQASRSLGFA